MVIALTRTQQQIRRLMVVLAVACVITPVFNVVTSEASIRSAMQGLVDAVLITLLVGGYLVFVRDGRLRSWFWRLRAVGHRPARGSLKPSRNGRVPPPR